MSNNDARFVFFSDMHCHLFEDFAKPDPEYVNDRFRAQLVTLQEVFNIARKNEAVLVFGGDLFHKRAKIDDIVFNKVYEVFARNHDIKTILVRGNHDARTNATETSHWLETFRYLPHVTVAAVPEMLYIVDDNDKFSIYNEFRIAAIPYSDDVAFLKNKIKEYADRVKFEKEKDPHGAVPTVLVAHVGVDGSEVGKHSHRLEGAFEIGDLYPEVFDAVCLGHYHKRQFLGGTDNVFYAGNTIQTSFSDEGQDKGVFLVDFDKPKVAQFIPIHNKKFITLTEITEDTQEIVDNNYVRFILPQDQAQEVEIFKEANDNIRVEVQREYKTETRIDIDVDSTEQQAVEAYTKEFYPNATTLALEILNEAISNK